MEFLDLTPRTRAHGTLDLPGSKSISNRTLLLAGLSGGETVVRHLLKSDDTDRMLDALRTLGVTITDAATGAMPSPPAGGNWPDLRISAAGGAFPVKAADLFLGNAGTAFRPLVAALALSGGTYTLRGVPRMHERPIRDLVDALRQLGAEVTYLENEGFPPIRIGPGAWHNPGQLHLRGDVSSQFLTALLLSLPLTGWPVEIVMTTELISKPYVDTTIRLLEKFGITVGRRGWESFRLPEAAKYQSPGTVLVEGDASSASYFLAAGALGGGPVRVQGVGSASTQGDVAFANALEELGAHVVWGEDWIEVSGPASGKLRAFDRDFNHIPDAAMTLGVLALFCDGPCRLTNIGSWRVKETDRIAAMATELRKLGAQVEAGQDWLAIMPPSKLTPGASIATYDDHRMAMCFSLATFGGVPVRILDPGCTAKTFPQYFTEFAKLTH